MRRAALSTAVLLLLVGCSASTKTAANSSPSPSPSASQSERAANEVDIYNNSFSPSPLTVSAGTVVVWRNFGSKRHNVVSDTNLFHSNPSCNGGVDEPTKGSACMQVGDIFRYPFAKASTYRYHCAIHSIQNADGTYSGMAGQIIVT